MHWSGTPTHWNCDESAGSCWYSCAFSSMYLPPLALLHRINAKIYTETQGSVQRLGKTGLRWSALDRHWNMSSAKEASAPNVRDAENAHLSSELFKEIMKCARALKKRGRWTAHSCHRCWWALPGMWLRRRHRCPKMPRRRMAASEGFIGNATLGSSQA